MTPLRILLRVAGGIAAGVTIALLVLPVAALVLHTSPGALISSLGEERTVQALRLSAVTSLVSLLLVVAIGAPTAVLLAGRAFRGKALLETLITLPMVLPPTVAGLGLLLAFGRAGLLGRTLGQFGIAIPFTTIAVVVAQTFVALPFFITAATTGLRAIDARYLEAAATLRASPWHRTMRVTLPLALPSLAAGAAMGWARALGEFGATITLAGNLPGRTQTMPLAVYFALETDLDAAVALAVLLLAVSFGVLLAVRASPLHAEPAGASRPGR